MRSVLILLLLSSLSGKAQTITETFGAGINSFTIDFVKIGNPGNVADTGVYPASGSVSYSYNLGKYEVSRDMVLKASTAGGLGLTLADLTSYGGNGINRPASGISWNEAARFVNWLNTSKGYQAAYKFTTSGANDNISVWGAGEYSGSNQFRHKNAYYFLPSTDEWYKGAYGSPTGTWYNYPNGSDSVPTSVSGGSTGAVYYRGSGGGPADITNAGGPSAFGTIAQGGNVWEWTETEYDGINNDGAISRDNLGGSWDRVNSYLLNQVSNSIGPTWEGFDIGFRVAMIPEPSTFSFLAVSLAGLLAFRRRK